MGKMHLYDDVKSMVEDEIEKISKQGDLNHESLMNLDALIDISKDICEIQMSSDEMETGYSQRMYPQMYYDGGYNHGNSYRGMGRYSRMDGGDMNNYSRHGDIADRLGKMMTEATTDREREAIRRALETI